jgi:spore coat polysaccharide biosynthesis protein SpsF
MDGFAFIIQARIGSTRLPGKMVKPFSKSKGIFELLLINLKKNFSEIPIIVATTTDPKDDELIKICARHQILSFRGSEDNVLDRFICACQQFKITRLIRICADNPFLNISELYELVSFSIKADADYISFGTKDGTPTIQTHYGLWAEYVTLQALMKVQELTKEKEFLEHVTNYIYSYPEKFKIELMPISHYLSQNNFVRLTLDTIDDFDLLKEIFNVYPDFNKGPDDLVELISINQHWVEIMRKQIEQNQK